ncbi:HGR059Cp [Eremothecium sinecaudum]|uniref:HGR059Cp n=1 Tax=Eremothecium sinecaudum TaxID=45286 RepID=A0A120K2R7_9SACH|nr:HGR059Cp [Eremothecium sinecaudum]AMD22398.1 HGR059Cp [Eremothecium sinecaudum]
MTYKTEADNWKAWLIAFKVNTSNLDDDSLCTNFEASFTSFLQSLKDERVDDETRLLLTDAIGIWLLRSHQLINSGRLPGYKEIVKNKLLNIDEATYLFRYVIDFWSGGGAALANSLRHMFMKLMQLLEDVYGDDVVIVFEGWVRQTLTISPSMKFLYYLLEVFAARMDLKIVLEEKPAFIETSLSYMWSESLCSPVGKCITCLLVNLYNRHYTVDKVDKWLELWEKSVMKYLKDGKSTKKVQLYVLKTLFESTPAVAFNRFIIRNTKNEPVGILLPLLQIGQKLGIEDEPFDEDKLVPLNTLEELLSVDKYKLTAFEILTFSAKRSKPIKPYVYDIVKRNLVLFFVDYDIETRNYFHSSFKHFISRIRDSTYSLNRDALKLKAKNKFPDEQQEKLEQVELAKAFIEYFLSYLMFQIAPGTQYQRNSLACKFIKTLILSGVDDTIPPEFLDSRKNMEYPFHIKVFNRCMVRLLCDNLSNDYIDVREMSLDLLVIALKASNSEEHLQMLQSADLKRKAYQLLNFYKGSDGGSKILELQCLISKDKTLFIEEQLKQLDEFLTAIESDLIRGIENPIAGLFTTLDLLFSRYEFNDGSEVLLNSCIDLVIRNWNSVRDILSHDSPEGNLPVRYSNADISDQIITSYAFRSIKESSSLLSTLFQRAPISKTQLIRSGELIITQLSVIRHSGAFQSIIPSFDSFCMRCMTDLPEQMKTWLTESISSLQTKTQYITRRSGGLPFLISAILAAEKDPKRPLLKDTYKALSDIARIPILEHEERLDLPQVNAFNCIRSLFITSKLSEACTAYVYPALELCLEKFTSPLWAMRNCSFMLFTALQNRLFGKIGKNTSARLFFTRFKGIREILLKRLQESIDITSRPTTARSIASSNNSLAARSEISEIESIFLVLTIISRLKLTPGYDGLDSFKLEIIKCLENRNWRIREMASRALPALISFPYDESLKLLKDKKSTIKHQNRLHGHMLAAKELITSELKRVDNKPIPAELCKFVLRNFRRYIVSNQCSVTAKAYIELVQVILTHGGSAVDTEDKSNFIRFIGQYFIERNETYILDGGLQLLMANIINILLLHESPDHKLDIILLGLYSTFFEVQLSTLKYLHQKLNSAKPKGKIHHELIERMVSMLRDQDILPQVKSLILNNLEISETKIEPDLLLSILEGNQSEEMQTNALALLGISSVTPQQNYKILRYINEFSRDEMPQPFRLSSLRYLMNFASLTTRSLGSYRNFCFIYRHLWDDDVNIRTAAANFINKNFLLSFQSKDEISAYTTATMLMKAVEIESNNELITELVIGAIKDFNLKFKISEIKSASVYNDLFAVEDDNQFRNVIDYALCTLSPLKGFSDVRPEFRLFAARIIESALKDLDTNPVDSVLGCGSDPVLFSSVVILRMIANFICPSMLPVIDNKLREYRFHPLAFDYTKHVELGPKFTSVNFWSSHNSDNL